LLSGPLRPDAWQSPSEYYIAKNTVRLLVVTDLDVIMLNQLCFPVEFIFQFLMSSRFNSDPALHVALYFDLQAPDLIYVMDQLAQADSAVRGFCPQDY